MWAYHVLGLPPDADERAVKRAYAQRLKTTRPEDDPNAFARLVEARDAAMAWARDRAALADEPPFEIEEPAAAPPSVPLPVQPAPEAREAPMPAIATEPAGTPLAPPDPSDGAPVPPPATTASDLEPEIEPNDADGTADAGAEDPPLVPLAIAMAQRETAEKLQDRIRQRLNSWNATDLDAWDRILAEADTLSLNVRQDFEEHLAVTLNAALERIIWKGVDYPRAEIEMVTRIAEDFGWLQNSRRVVGFFWPADGSQALPRILHRILSRVPDPAVDANGIPIIDPFDLHTYYGSPSFEIVRYYERSVRQGRLGPSLYFSALLLPGSTLAYHRLLGLFSTILLVFGVVPLIALSEAPADWRPAINLVHGVSAIGLHLVIGLYAQRFSILHLARLSRAAMQQAPYRDEARARLIGRHQTSPQIFVFLGALAFISLIDIPVWQALREYVLK